MRLFIGIAPDRAARMALAETARMLKQKTKGRFCDPELYHITLAFLGDMEADRVPAIRSAVQVVATDLRSFSVSLGPVGSFGSILWRGIIPSEGLDGLSSALRTSLSAAQIPYDPKPFRAHITLAREAGLPPGVTTLPLPAAQYPITQLTLYESRRDGGTLRYRPLHIASLSK